MANKKTQIKEFPGHPEITKKLKITNAISSVSLILAATALLVMNFASNYDPNTWFLIGMAGFAVFFISFIVYNKTYKKGVALLEQDKANSNQ